MFKIGKKLQSKSGVTLIEVLISLAVAGISILSMFLMFPKMKALVDIGHHKTAAIRAAQVKVEDIRRSGFSSTVAGVTTEAVTLDAGTDLTTNADDLQGVLTTTVTDIFSGAVLIAKKVLVQCQWNDHHTVINEYVDFVLYRNVP